MRAILSIILLCTAFSVGRTQAEPSAETVARGKALVVAADCASCHTADPAMPFAGGKRIDTPFGRIYSPNLTPDRVTNYIRNSWGNAAPLVTPAQVRKARMRVP